MEWNGMEWNEMEWNGTEWNGMEWNENDEGLVFETSTFEPCYVGQFTLIIKSFDKK